MNITEKFDIAVIGAGPSGTAAALAAARSGARVILLDRNGAPGGSAAACHIPILFGFSESGKQITGGIAEEIVRCLDSMGQASFYTVGYAKMPEYLPIGGRPITKQVATDINSMQIAYNSLLEKAGVTRLFFTHCFGTENDGDRIRGLHIDCLEGNRFLEADYFIDASGDAHIVFRAGGACVTHSVDDSLHKSLFFELGGVNACDLEAAENHYRQMFESGQTPSGVLSYLARSYTLNPGVALIALAKAVGMGVNSADMTRMDAELRSKIPEIAVFLKQNIPGFSHSFLSGTAFSIGVRSGRCIKGIQTYSPEILASPGIPQDAIALTRRGYGSHSTGRTFLPEWANGQMGVCGIPYGTLVPERLENILACGRSLSYHPYVADTIRMMGICMATGEAAGTAIVQALKKKIPAREVDVNELRNTLMRNHAILEV